MVGFPSPISLPQLHMMNFKVDIFNSDQSPLYLRLQDHFTIISRDTFHKTNQEVVSGSPNTT